MNDAGHPVTVPSRQADEALDRMAVSREMELLFQASRTSPMLHEAAVAVDAELGRLRERVYVLENMRSDNYIEALEAAEARVRRLEDGLREIEQDVNDGKALGHIGYRIRSLLAGADERQEGREGMVTAYDHEGRYVGCIGAETWRWLIDHPEIDLPAMQRAYDLFRPKDERQDG